MPEWPDLHVVRGRLEKALLGREIVLVGISDKDTWLLGEQAP